MKPITLRNLKATQMNTNFIGALHGIAKYHGYHISQQWLMGGMGMAFFINIHRELCPSGPYVFNLDPFMDLAKNLGLEIIPLGFFHNNVRKEDLAKLETIMKELLSENIPLILQNMDNQVIYGYDEKGFLLDPYDPDSEEFFPQRLTFSSWNEFKGEFHASVWAVKKIPPQIPRKVITDALKFAEQAILGKYLEENEDVKDYKTGKNAYDTWIQYLQNNDGNNHGHWWNAGVWGECRKHAELFFRNLIMIEENHDHILSKQLSEQFALISKKLHKARVKELPQDQKKLLITEIKELELNSIENLRNLCSSF